MKLFLVGGFLGSGKTTAIATAAKLLTENNVPIAVITNDQGSQLVDGAFINSLNVPGSEIKNGCFCCNYEQFVSAILGLKKSVEPKIILAEAVGSCTDLIATIVKPLSQFEPAIDISLSVFADGPVLLSSLEGRSSFVSDNIQYIYKKQLEEAAIIIVNKADLLGEEERDKIESMVLAEYPGKKLLVQDSRDETSVTTWLDTMEETNTTRNAEALNIHYDKYAAGEAALAWLNATVTIHSPANAMSKACTFIDDMFAEISFQKFPIGHLKFFLQTGNWKRKISYTSNKGAKRGNFNQGLSADHATVIVNARIETHPDDLKKIFYQLVTKIEDENSQIEVLNLESFKPGYPQPTYRLIK